MAAHDHYGGKKHAKKVRDQGKHQMRGELAAFMATKALSVACCRYTNLSKTRSWLVNFFEMLYCCLQYLLDAILEPWLHGLFCFSKTSFLVH